jgi:hypothetical protein
MEQWITQELERIELGDTKRTKQLIKIVENLNAKPEASIPLPVTKNTYVELEFSLNLLNCHQTQQIYYV